ncbi:MULTISPECIES: hypothetical protein [unclassified Rickettsia]
MLKQVQHDKEKSGFPPLARMTSKICAMQRRMVNLMTIKLSTREPQF